MATTVTATPTPAGAPPNAAVKPAKPAGPRPDLATISGITLAMAGIIGGLILEKGSISEVAQGTAAMIVLGGTFGAVLVTTPMAIVVRAFKGLGAVFFERPDGIPDTIETLIGYAGKARKHGIVSLETEAAQIAD